MKGHMKIELFDAKTGKREEVHEDDNLVTNAVKYLLSYVNRLNRAPSNDVFPIATNSLGGGMLFDDTVEEAVVEVAGEVEETLEAAEEAPEAMYSEEVAVPEAEKNGENA